jgi:hypothetical protein
MKDHQGVTKRWRTVRRRIVDTASSSFSSVPPPTSMTSASDDPSPIAEIFSVLRSGSRVFEEYTSSLEKNRKEEDGVNVRRRIVDTASSSFSSIPPPTSMTSASDDPSPIAEIFSVLWSGSRVFEEYTSSLEKNREQDRKMAERMDAEDGRSGTEYAAEGDGTSECQSTMGPREEGSKATK